MIDENLLKRLCVENGVSGDENLIQEIILKEIKPFVQECYKDSLGNIIALKKGKKKPKLKLLISAHMDEVGFIITYITKEGFLKFSKVGGIDDKILPGKRVLIGKNKILGIIGTKPIHLLNSDERGKYAKISDMYIDIGAKNEEEANKLIELGDTACFETFFENANGIIKSKAIDDRAGCAVLIDIIKSDFPFDVYFSFVTREEVGLIGAKTAAYKVEPDVAIVVEATTAADIAGVSEEKQVCKLLNGAVLSFMDLRTIYDKEYFKLGLKAAKVKGVKAQIKKAVAGGNDAGAIQSVKGGVRTIAVSVPCRYLHSGELMAALEDIEAVSETVKELSAMILKD